jgi:hypothetical protein
LLNRPFSVIPARTGQGTGYEALAIAPYVSTGFNFNLFGNRHFLGLGYANVSFSNQSIRVPATSVSSTSFIFFEGRDMWPVANDRFVFLDAKIGAYAAGVLDVSLLAQIGYDF